MSFIRGEKNKNYTVMSNYHLKDKTLSLKAKGLLSFMLSLPEEWDFSVNGLVSVLQEGRDCIRAVLNELEQKGYLVREQVRTENGTFGRIDFVVYEEPRCMVKSVENAEVLPQTGFPSTVESATGKTTQRKTKAKRNTKKNKDSLQNLSEPLTEKEVRAKIEYEYLIQEVDASLVDNLVGLIIEMDSLANYQEGIRIGGLTYPSEYVLSQINRIEKTHIIYVLECFSHQKEPIRNIKAYMQASLLNAPNTIDAYYSAEVRYDFGCRG